MIQFFRRHFFCLFFLSAVCFSVRAQQAAAPGAVTVTLVNTLDSARTDEPFAWTRAELEKKLGVIPAGKYVQLSDDAGAPVGVQFDDLDQDGSWDEIFFVRNFRPHEKCKLGISVSENPAAIKMAVRAHVRMRPRNPDNTWGAGVDSAVMPMHNPPTDFSVKPEPDWLTEGPGWENDKVAYRLYFDTRNGKDIYGKRIPGMVMEDVGAHPGASYHVLADWGMDILKVGSSLGAGSLAIYLPGSAGKDTLIRLGGMQVKSETFRKVADGPLRAIFRMDYDWEINGGPVHIREEITIGAGQYYYSSKVFVSGAPAKARLVTGIANFYSNEPGNFRKGRAVVLYSHGRQSENKDFLGMAVLVDKRDFASFRSLPASGSDITSTYTVSQNIGKDNPLSFRFYTAWEKTDMGFASSDYFVQMLKQEVEKYNNPVQVNW